MLDLQVLLSETRESPPCGLNLEHDLSFFELDEAARGKPEQRVGDAVRPAEDPKWSKVIELAQGLLLRTKDLRVAIHLTRALTRTEGIQGLATGLRLTHGLLERYWEQVHPLLEADRDNDPTERLNALAPLADSDAVVKDVRDAFLVRSREHGQLQAREVEMALGRLVSTTSAGPGPSKSLPQIHAQIATAFANDPTVPTALREAYNSLGAIQALVAERLASDRGIEIKPLMQPLESLLEACDAALGRAVGHEVAAPATEARSLSIAGEIRTRDEAVRLLELVCTYFERHEPSNPAPLFIRRAQRLMQKNFVEIVKDLLPDSLSNLEKLAGELKDT
jgi:type VI secretion system protein ImpA